MQVGVADWLDDGTAPGRVAIRRILAPNPSPMTGAGTNSYLLGQGKGVALVDPGPDIDAHVAAIMTALQPGEAIAAIVVTHAHLDHSAAAPRLSALTGAPMLAFGGATSGRSPAKERLAKTGLTGGGEGLDLQFQPDRTLRDGDHIEVSQGAAQDRAEVIHTPGHLGGHIALGIGGYLLSGDHAMGWSTSLVSPPDGCMQAYMQSLRILAARPWRMMLPGHGPEVADVAARLADLITHRQQREAEVLAALAQTPASLSTLTAQIYAQTPAHLLAAASRNVLAHLIDLTDRNLVRADGFPGPGATFSRI